jgi:NodT family efflux transporter outer membrane factor (OMF) lipoprotein
LGNVPHARRHPGLRRPGAEFQRLALGDDHRQGGAAAGLDVARAETQLSTARAQVADIAAQRALMEHAIAALVGQPASNFSVAASPLQEAAPPLPLGVPSDVLERRPDIATAERQIAYANAQIGIARAAFYPHITLSGSGGWQSRDLGALVNAPSLFWALGADALQPVFQGGRNRANLAATRSAYDASVANYRQSVLTAFQQVEDGISNLQTLNQAAITQAAAVEDARSQLTFANNRYVGGVTTYLDVITAQSTLLNNERLATQLLGQQMISSVYLVKALGGGWNASDLKDQQVRPQANQIIQP